MSVLLTGLFWGVNVSFLGLLLIFFGVLAVAEGIVGMCVN